MAIIPISSLPAASAAQLTDELPENQGGTTKRVTIQQISNLIAGPIIAGTGTDSAIGGDGTSIASGNYSFAYGDSTNTSAAANSFAFGTFNTINTGAIYSVAFGNGNIVATNGQYNYLFGNACESDGTGNVLFGGGTGIATNKSGCFSAVDNSAFLPSITADNQFSTYYTNGYRLSGGSINVLTAGSGLAVKEGSNAKQGTVTLVAGVGVVSNTSITANSRIFYCGQDTNVTGFLTITARTASSGFTITSSVNTDTGVVAYEIFEPAA